MGFEQDSGSHSRISPSGMARVVQCPGSVRMEEKYPRPRGDAANEGTRAHSIAAQMLRGIPSGGTADEAVTMYVDDVLSTVEQRSCGLDIEHKIDISGIMAGMVGTPDAVAKDYIRRDAIIWDFKYGWGLVDEWHNWQGICYIAGIYEQWIEKYEFRVVQPRPWCNRGRIRRWIVTPSELMPLITIAKNACALALSDNPPLATGRECRYCGALLYCPAAADTAHHALDVTEGFNDIPSMDYGAALTVLTSAKDIITQRITALEEHIVSQIKAGQQVRGWAMEKTHGRLEWTRPDAEIVFMGTMLGVDLRSDGAKTPKQCERVLSVPVMQMLTKQEGKYKLIPDGGNKARQIFGG